MHKNVLMISKKKENFQTMLTLVKVLKDEKTSNKFIEYFKALFHVIFFLPCFKHVVVFNVSRMSLQHYPIVERLVQSEQRLKQMFQCNMG